MTQENREYLISWLSKLKEKEECGDNNERNSKIYPCCYSPKAKTKEDIDNPFFIETEEDWSEFWEICKEYYPLHSVFGGYNGKTPEYIKTSEVKEFIKRIENYSKLNKNTLSKNVLEIGFGFGGCGHYLMNKYKSNYHGIDFTFSDKTDKEYKFKGQSRFHKIPKSGIPDYLKNTKYNLIFSTNVFQHLTLKQRLDYYKEVYNCLDDNGVFYFDLFNKVGRTKDTFSTHFFLAYTKVNTKKEIKQQLKKIGFKHIEFVDEVYISPHTHLLSIKCTK